MIRRWTLWPRYRGPTGSARRFHLLLTWIYPFVFDRRRRARSVKRRTRAWRIGSERRRWKSGRWRDLLAVTLSLKGQDAEIAFKPRLHGLCGGMGSGGGGEIRKLVIERDRPDFAAVLDRLRALGGVDHEVDLTVLEHVNDVGAALGDLVHNVTGQPGLGQEGGGAACRHEAEAQVGEYLGCVHKLWGFVAVLDRDEHPSALGQVHPRAHLCLEEGAREGYV